jgi:hypothetical protein
LTTLTTQSEIASDLTRTTVMATITPPSSTKKVRLPRGDLTVEIEPRAATYVKTIVTPNGLNYEEVELFAARVGNVQERRREKKEIEAGLAPAEYMKNEVGPETEDERCNRLRQDEVFDWVSNSQKAPGFVFS